MKHVTFLVLFAFLRLACTNADLPPSTFTPTATATPEATATAMPTEAPKFTFASVGISETSELGKALATHRGLEGSITAEAGGAYSANVITLL